MTSSISKKLEVGPGRIDATHIFPKKKNRCNTGPSFSRPSLENKTSSQKSLMKLRKWVLPADAVAGIKPCQNHSQY
jgi:hypothetical protein